MNTAELKKLAEAATPGKRKEYAPEISNEIDEGYRYIEIGGGTVLRDWISKNDAAFIAACDPAAILELLAVNAELVDALKQIRTAAMATVCNPVWVERRASIALAKAEGEQS